MTQAATLTLRNDARSGFAARIAAVALHPLQLLVAVPSFLFLAALTAMLLRPPDVAFYEIDRITFVLLALAVVARAVLMRERLLLIDRATWPMIGLTLLATAGVLSRPFDSEAWSLLAAKLIVPFALYHLAGHVFIDERRFRQFEIFCVVVLAYLSFTAIAFLAGANSLIFPQFILDESLGFHFDRARGPFLQAVANGVSLNMLGLIALHAYRRASLRGTKILLLLASVPIAILATMTRAVWLTFAGTIAVLVFFSKNHRLRLTGLGCALMAGTGLAIFLTSTELGGTLGERLLERGPVDYREAVYAGGWDMFLQHPAAGWGFHQMPAELPKYVAEYNEKTLYPHNTYLELLVEEGVVGLALYLWRMLELWELGRASILPDERAGFLNTNFHRLWPILLAVYWINALVVVMNYQFVNGLLFTMAGMLAAQRRRSEACQC
jgi:putative inorganic carbon (hco3(-)) transporter